MFLKRLELRGFKSFADSTRIEFMPGINVIVGPNGCGKSNTVDAIRWVLGEQNLRSLRGQRAEDVIFAGTDRKKSLSMASVSVVLDNADAVLPIEYSEVTITRKVFRSGESEFYLNKSQVRLKDIQQLLMGTGLGKKGFAIIGQGELEALLDARPLELRLILEEASGLIKYRFKKQEAEEKLAATARDLERVEDLIGELTMRAEDLKVRAERARAFMELDEEAADIARRLLVSDWLAAVDHRSALVAQMQTVRESRQKADEVLAEHERAVVDLRERQTQVEERLALLRQQELALGKDINELQGEALLNQERSSDIEKRLVEAGRERERLVRNLEEVAASLAQVKEKKDHEESHYQEKTDELTREEGQLQALMSGRDQEIARFEELKEAVLAAAQEESHHKARLSDLKEEQLRLSEREKRHAIGLSQQQEAVSEQEGMLERLASLGRERQQARSREEARVNQITEDLSRARSRLEEIRRRVAETQKQRARLAAEIAQLRSMETSHAGFSEAVRALLKHREQHPDFMPGFIGAVSDLIEVPRGLETAIDVAIGRGYENLVVMSEDDGRQGIDFLRRAGVGRATFLPLSLLATDEAPRALVKRMMAAEGAIGLASDLVRVDPAYRAAILYLLGRVFVVDELDHGLSLFRKEHPPVRIVTRGGEVINARGAMSGGHSKAGASPIKRKADLRRLEDKMRETEKVLSDLARQESEISAQCEGLAGQRDEFQRKLAEIDYRLELEAAEAERIREAIRSGKERLGELGWEGRLLADDRTRIACAIKEAENAAQEAGDRRATLEGELEESRQQSEMLLRKLEVGQERLLALKEVLAARARELAALRQNYEQMAGLSTSYQQSLAENEKQAEALLKELAGRRSRVNAIREELKAKEKDWTELKEHIALAEGEQSSLRSRLDGAMREGAELRSESMALADKEHQLEVRLARQEAEVCRLEEEMSETPAEGEGVRLAERAAREMKERLDFIRRRCAEMGPVDAYAIKEYGEVSERLDFLTGQHSDLIRARASLLKLAAETDKIMSGRFAEFMVKANESFSRTFEEIFGGGEAGLVLDEEAGGVEIMVRMPGKKRQPLTALSGGERSLTCIALIFALLRLNPSPFCLLDEIDAALDDVNLQRFSSFVRRFASGIQFIIISHRQGTIEMAANIYGVTMPEHGVSTVLSLELGEAVDLAG